MAIELVLVESGPSLDDVRKLFLEYAQSLNFEFCFETFEKELRDLPGNYTLILCRVDGTAAGCVAMRPIEPGICEMKRLYVRPEFRGKRVGKALTDRLLGEARRAGCKAVRLDTIAGAMDQAIALYRSIGFKEIAPYSAKPIPNALYMQLDL